MNDAPYFPQTEAGEPRKPTNDEDLYLQLREWVEADIEHSRVWRSNARSEFTFAAGPGQWDEQDRQRLRDEQRPDVTFNKTLKFIRAVCGIEANNRHEMVFLPVDITNPGEVKANEVITGAADWMERGCNADKKQSRAFRDALICGMGWTEAHLDFDQDPKGKYVETRIPPWEMGWDRDARDDNIADSKRRWRIRTMPLADARALIPGVTDAEGVTIADLDASWASDEPEKNNELKSKERKELREESMVHDDPKRRVTIVQIQWYEMETYRRMLNPAAFTNPQAPKTVDVSEEEYAQLGGNMPSAKLRRRVFKQAFLGGKLLEAGPAPRRDGFTLHCVTYEPDDVAGVWFGLVRVLRDPQVWSNKFFSQLMHIVNSTAKGGIIIEADAMDDAREFLANYAKPNAVTVVTPGAIGKGKVMAKPGAGITGGVLTLMQIADSAFPQTIGINLEMMGLADRQQAGVLEAQRKQAAMTILATLFDNYSQFKQEVGRTRLAFLQTHLARDIPRMIRVVGEDGFKAIPLIASEIQGDYDVIVSEAPSSPNTKEKVWAALMQVLPAFRDMLTPEVALTILDYAPGLPTKLVDSLRAIASKPNPDALQQKQLAIAGALADIRNKNADTEQKGASADAARAGAILDIANVGLSQQRFQVDAYAAILDQLGAREQRQIDATAATEGALSAAQAEAPQPRQLPELGEMRPPQEQPGMMPPAGLQMPGGL